jgi:hypothetical protein
MYSALLAPRLGAVIVGIIAFCPGGVKLARENIRRI